MKRFLLIIVIILSVNGSAYALMPVVDYAALIKLGQELTQLEEQARLIRQELKQLSNDQYHWSNAQPLINQLGQIMQQSHGIAYSAQDEASQFQQDFPGYQAPTDFNQQYKNLIAVTLNTQQGVLQTFGRSDQDFQNENSRLSFLQNQIQNAKGETQAIQAASQIASEQVSQMQLLRQTIMLQANSQAAYYAAKTQTEASNIAIMDQVIASGNHNTTGILNAHPINDPFE